MVDLTNPSPLIMTNFERIGTFSSLVAVAVVAFVDVWRALSKRRSRSATRER